MTRYQEVPWLRLGAESVAIVASILLDFAIDAWWEDNQARAEEQTILLSLKAEFEYNVALIERELGYRHAVVSSILKIFDASSERTVLEPETVDQLLGDVTWWGEAEYSTGAIDSLLQGGMLSIIENDELRRSLASLPGEYSASLRSEVQDQETARDIIYPFLSENASLTQIANTMAGGRPGTGLGLTPPIYPVVEHRDHSALLGDSEFLGILVREHWDQLDAIEDYENLQASIERVMRLIDEDLNDKS